MVAGFSQMAHTDCSHAAPSSSIADCITTLGVGMAMGVYSDIYWYIYYNITVVWNGGIYAYELIQC